MFIFTQDYLFSRRDAESAEFTQRIYNFPADNEFLSRRNRRNRRNFSFSLILMPIVNHAAWLGEAHFCHFRYFCGTKKNNYLWEVQKNRA